MEFLKKLAKAADTTGASNSLGVMGPTLSALLIIVNTTFGLITEQPGAELVAENDVDAILGAGNSIVNAVGVIAGTLTGIIGRWRARKKIGGGDLEAA